MKLLRKILGFDPLNRSWRRIKRMNIAVIVRNQTSIKSDIISYSKGKNRTIPVNTHRTNAPVMNIKALALKLNPSGYFVARKLSNACFDFIVKTHY